ncbi:FAD-dependent oxidoreductase [Pollutimonas nitritireducens]|uniref:FAD-dependent oxidoreductase n=1 Tax=Pollutimonas nitritireducens TaxID=2045209 RepID=A0A2N4UE20_9BURK|nr:FAD-dependent oxidoreductase [Pollutimonas nitritireducens]PLC53265.1 FAD-dependent oxidoreductase [Pollutimonas nitritireducens]
MTMSNDSDVLVVGAGLVGSAIAYGLLRQGLTVTLLDEGDVAFRASRGNFGLVWVQGKGFGCSAYARWSLASSRLWPGFAADLLDETQVNVELVQNGGFHFCLNTQEFVERRERLEWLQAEVGPHYEFEMLEQTAMRGRLPGVGPDVTGASYTPMDGHVNPLKLFHALHKACLGRGAVLHVNRRVQDILHTDGTFHVATSNGAFQAPRLVLAAGLGNKLLADKVGLHAPVQPNQGQVLIGERIAPFLKNPTIYVRQTDEGTIQIGDSMEDCGFNDTTRTDVLAGIAARAIVCFPKLANLNIVRSWAALRVMTPDGYPIYQESRSCPGAFVATCHSGVTLAAAHAMRIAPWMAGQAQPDELYVFSGDRFLDPHRELHNDH